MTPCICRAITPMNGCPDGPSPALLAAQRRLEEARKSYQRSAGVSQRSDSTYVSPATDFEPAAASCQLPAADHDPLATEHTVRLYPDIALGMLGQGMAASGRVWLLLRYLDGDGRGWLPLDQAQEALSDKGSDLRVCGRRQLRNLLRQGEGIFWQRDKERLWLKSAARVATALGIERLRGRPVALPLAALLGGIGQVRAHFYATFHSGRAAQEKERTGSPISRATLEKITHTPARTQRLYEARAGVKRQANMAIGERLSQENLQQRAWQHGRAAFMFVDSEGKQGPAGGRYVAWRLPNSYRGPHATCPKGRIKKINRQIDLVNSRAQGNDLDRPSGRLTVERLFHANGQEAGRAYNRCQESDLYWPAGRRRAGHQRLWRVLPTKTS